jgi:hypothetical protein
MATSRIETAIVRCLTGWAWNTATRASGILVVGPAVVRPPRPHAQITSDKASASGCDALRPIR